MLSKTIIIFLLLLPYVLSAQTYTRQIHRKGADFVTNDTIKVIITEKFVTIGRDCYQVEKVINKTYFLSEGAKIKRGSTGVFFWSKAFNIYFDRELKHK